MDFATAPSDPVLSLESAPLSLNSEPTGLHAWLSAQQTRLEQILAQLDDLESVAPDAAGELLLRLRQQLQRMLADQRQLVFLHDQELADWDRSIQAANQSALPATDSTAATSGSASNPSDSNQTAFNPSASNPSDSVQRAADEAEIARLRAEVNLLRERLQTEPSTNRSTFNWEQEKQRILRELETEQPAAGPDPHLEQRRRLQHAMQLTDDIVAASRREVDRLRRKLEETMSRRAERPGPVLNAAPVTTPHTAQNMASNSTSNSGSSESDTQILEERERLAALQQQTREKLRQAEVAMSLERAKLARDRGELQAKMLALETERTALLEQLQAATQQAGSQRTAGRNGKQLRTGRWLARLGLREE